MATKTKHEVFQGNPPQVVDTYESIDTLFRWRLTGKENKDVAFVNKVRALVEKLNGECVFNYAHKDIYCFEIGGEFTNQTDADKFDAAYEKLAK